MKRNLMLLATLALVWAVPAPAAEESPEDEAPGRVDYIEKARAGDTDAQYQVGLSFCCEGEDDKNMQRATWWFCDAARKNHKDAQFQVGEIYRTDRTLPIAAEELSAHPQLNDDVLAYVWFKIAEKNGHGEAKAAAEKVKANLSKAELREAESMIPFFPYVPCEIEVGATEEAEATVPESEAAPAAGE